MIHLLLLLNVINSEKHKLCKVNVAKINRFKGNVVPL